MVWIIVFIIVVAFMYFFFSKETTFTLIPITILILCTIGYIYNIVYLVNYSFKEPYRAEAIRTVGVIVPPLGAVLGYIHIPEGETTQLEEE